MPREQAILRWGQEGSGEPEAGSSNAPHPFQVGKRYRNRLGEYEVVNLDGPNMVIQYEDGNTLETTVRMQERIWRNIQLDAKIQREQEKQHRASRHSYPRPKFDGFGDQDFQDGVRGTSWRRKSELGGLLARRMTRLTAFQFDSYPVRGKPRLHIASASADKVDQRRRQAKFILELDEGQARYGFNIKRRPGDLDEGWQWPAFMEALAENSALQRQLEGSMRQHNLDWEVREWNGRQRGPVIARVQPAAEQAMLLWNPTGGEVEMLSWSGLVQRLSQVAQGQGCDLYLATSMDKGQAIAAGEHVVTPLTEVYRALVPLYEPGAPSTEQAESPAA